MTLRSNSADQPLPSSFRDPSGYVFQREGEIYRKVNPCYLETYARFMESGLYAELVSKKLLVSHAVVDEPDLTRDGGVVILPRRIPVVSYPYEWSFQQLKDAALLTLSIAGVALKHGMVLKDASAYNVQFLDGEPVFIDTLSFEPYEEGSPWVAYGQFCRHFLAPLYLAARKDYRCMLLTRDFIDGVPLDYARALLGPPRRLSLTEIVHLRLHARLQRSKAGDQGKSTQGKRLPKSALLGLLDSLESGVRKLEWKPGRTEWGDYYSHTNYTDQASLDKKERIAEMIESLQPEVVWDIGANDGTYSRIAAKNAKQVVALDIDPVAVNANYKKSRRDKETNLLPLLMDFTNPSPGIGWLCAEREALFARASADLVMALAVVHHFCISNNVSLERLVDFFASITRGRVLVEFVPKSDSQVEILLATREDVFPRYELEAFKHAFDVHFELERERTIQGSGRTLLLFKKRGMDAR